MSSDAHEKLSPLRSEPEAAEYLRTTVNHVRRLRIHGDLPCVRLGRKVRYHVDDLEGLIEAQRG